MITVSINRKSSTGEYVVSECRDNRLTPGSTYYTEDSQDAVDTAIFVIEDYRMKGQEAEMSTSRSTMRIVERLGREWLLREASKS